MILDDSVAEDDEVFTIFLQADGSVDVLDNRSSVPVTIISDDSKLWRIIMYKCIILLYLLFDVCHR